MLILHFVCIGLSTGESQGRFAVIIQTQLDAPPIEPKLHPLVRRAVLFEPGGIVQQPGNRDVVVIFKSNKMPETLVQGLRHPVSADGRRYSCAAKRCSASCSYFVPGRP